MAAGAATWVTASVAGCAGNGGNTTTQQTTTAKQPETYVVTDEMATGGAFGISFASSCSPTRLFAPGMEAIWEINVYDPDTGKQLTDEDLSAVKVNIDNGPTVTTKWAGDDKEHPAPYWEGSWNIPKDAKTGKWTYTIEVQKKTDANFISVGEATGSFTVQKDEMPNFYVSTETYWNGGPDAVPEGTNGFVGTCAPEREFFPSMDPTFFVQIYATETGKLVGAKNEKNSKVKAVSDTTVKNVTVRFPNTDKFSDLDMTWVPGTAEHSTPHWKATLSEPKTLPTGTYKYEIDIAGVNEKEDVRMVGAATDQFTVIKKQ
ncbi:MAG: hypothetical protein ABEJ60_05110 [Halodesulfurarchaeum sp.]